MYINIVCSINEHDEQRTEILRPWQSDSKDANFRFLHVNVKYGMQMSQSVCISLNKFVILF